MEEKVKVSVFQKIKNFFNEIKNMINQIDIPSEEDNAKLLEEAGLNSNPKTTKKLDVEQVNIKRVSMKDIIPELNNKNDLEREDRG